jgi:hypothetical protein
MPVMITGIKSGAGWGCDCPAFKFNPPARLVPAMLERMGKVTVKVVSREPDGSVSFRAWSDPTRVHVVEYSPDRPGGLCTHIVACADLLTGGIFKLLAEALEPPLPWEAATNEVGTAHWLDPEAPSCLCGQPIIGHTWEPAEEASCKRCQKIKEGRMKDHD